MTFIHVDQVERLAVRDKVGELASISLGTHEGSWIFALSHQQRGGDCWGTGGPLGFTPGRENPFPSRDAAVEAAIAKARTRWAGREREMAPQFAWLDTLITEQPDLFAPTHRKAA